MKLKLFQVVCWIEWEGKQKRIVNGQRWSKLLFRCMSLLRWKISSKISSAYFRRPHTKLSKFASSADVISRPKPHENISESSFWETSREGCCFFLFVFWKRARTNWIEMSGISVNFSWVLWIFMLIPFFFFLSLLTYLSVDRLMFAYATI